MNLSTQCCPGGRYVIMYFYVNIILIYRVQLLLFPSLLLGYILVEDLLCCDVSEFLFHHEFSFSACVNVYLSFLRLFHGPTEALK